MSLSLVGSVKVLTDMLLLYQNEDYQTICIFVYMDAINLLSS
nr:hypothetical protein [uncultured Allomuricauda sp.]